MFDNGIQRGFQDEDEGPFVAGAFQGEEPPDREEPAGMAGMGTSSPRRARGRPPAQAAASLR